MTKRGPKPQSAAVKEAKGNPGRRPVGKDPALTSDITVPAKASAKIIAPTWLKGGGKRVWDRLAPRLFGIKILTQVDADTFARYCRNFARWLDLQNAVDKEGSYYGTETGFSRPHPAMMLILRLEPILERTEDRFGLNPAERQRLFAQRAAQGIPTDLFSNDDGKSDSQPKPKSYDLEKSSAIGTLN